MIVNNPFHPGDTVWWNDEAWEVVEVRGNLCLISDIGESVSNVIQEEVLFVELELIEDQEDEADNEDDDFDLDDIPEDGQIESRGMLFCFACGMLAQPGDEEYDWCDHKTGDGCAYMHDMDGGHDDDDDDDDTIHTMTIEHKSHSANTREKSNSKGHEAMMTEQIHTAEVKIWNGIGAVRESASFTVDVLHENGGWIAHYSLRGLEHTWIDENRITVTHKASGCALVYFKEVESAKTFCDEIAVLLPDYRDKWNDLEATMKRQIGRLINKCGGKMR